MPAVATGATRLESVPTSDHWYVTNGADVVGPVGMSQVLRGIVHGKIPEYCQLRQESWRSWRPLDQIREIAELKRNPAATTEAPTPSAHAYAEAAGLLAGATDTGEATWLAMERAVQATGANVALMHRRTRPQDTLVTSCVYGEGAEMALGSEIPRDDPVFFAARLGARIVRNEGGGHTQRRVAERLGAIEPAVVSVTMFPISVGGVLVCVLEMGRVDHAFRRVDIESVQEIVDALSEWLERRGWRR